jgi:hypothetical protein
MPTGVKWIFTFTALCLLPFVLWALRPGQARTVSPRWFRLGKNDPFFYGPFKADGTPRKFAWCFVLGWFVLFLTVLWLLPSD